MASINFIPVPCMPREEGEKHLVFAKASGLPYLKEAARPALIVLGGGHSITPLEDELRAFPGDIWACGSVFQWCRSRGIEATFFAVDPLPEVEAMTEGAENAIVAETVHPSVITALKAMGSNAHLFELIETQDMVNHGTTAATCTPQLAIEVGYRDITYIGCESSITECLMRPDDPAASIYYNGTSHAYKNVSVVDDEWTIFLRVQVGDQAFITIPALLNQAEYLAKIIRVSPIFKEKGGGLLGAMIKDLRFDITHGVQKLHDKLAHNIAARLTPEQIVAARL